MRAEFPAQKLQRSSIRKIVRRAQMGVYRPDPPARMIDGCPSLERERGRHGHEGVRVHHDRWVVRRRNARRFLARDFEKRRVQGLLLRGQVDEGSARHALSKRSIA